MFSRQKFTDLLALCNAVLTEYDRLTRNQRLHTSVAPDASCNIAAVGVGRPSDVTRFPFATITLLGFNI